MLQFTNPIVGGVTLVRPAIQSPDYVPGVSGWAIKRDGTVEFNAGTFRGDLNIENPPSYIRASAADNPVTLKLHGPDPGGDDTEAGISVEITGSGVGLTLDGPTVGGDMFNIASLSLRNHDTLGNPYASAFLGAGGPIVIAAGNAGPGSGGRIDVSTTTHPGNTFTGNAFEPQDYQPAIFQGGVNVAKQWRYCRYLALGELVFAWGIAEILGSGAGGAVQVTLPYPAAAGNPGSGLPIGHFWISDSGTEYPGVALVAFGASPAGSIMQGQGWGSVGAMGNNAPFMTLGVGDFVRFAVCYERASALA